MMTCWVHLIMPQAVLGLILFVSGCSSLIRLIRAAQEHKVKTLIVETRPTSLYLSHGFMPTAPVTTEKQILLWKEASPIKQN
jgi:hypothetical protein